MVENVAKCDEGDRINGRISARKPVRARDAGNMSQNTTISHFATIEKGSLVQEFICSGANLSGRGIWFPHSL